jgi:hypothetical protein
MRNKYPYEYKKVILAEVTACADRNGISMILDREGLTFAHLQQWGNELTSAPPLGMRHTLRE